MQKKTKKKTTKYYEAFFSHTFYNADSPNVYAGFKCKGRGDVLQSGGAPSIFFWGGKGASTMTSKNK